MAVGAVGVALGALLFRGQRYAAPGARCGSGRARRAVGVATHSAPIPGCVRRPVRGVRAGQGFPVIQQLWNLTFFFLGIACAQLCFRGIDGR